MVALCALLGLTTGCSALRIGYSAAPDLVYWWLDGYADFSSGQTVRVRAAIARWFNWNRRTQLGDYAALLARAQTEVLADTTPARVCEWQADLTTRALTAFDEVAPAAGALMLTITPQQIQHIEHRYTKTNDEYRENFLQPDPAERTAAALKRIVDRAEMLYGPLGDAQRARIVEGLARSPFDPELWLAERRQRQQDMLQQLRRLTRDGATPDQAQAALHAYVERMQRSPREAYRRYAERLSEYNCAFAARIHNATTLAQRRVAVQRLAGWEADLRALAVIPDAGGG
jgi:hypothetical protein